MPHYTLGKSAQFIEEDIFQTIVPYPSDTTQRKDTLNILSKKVRDAVKNRLARELLLIAQQGGVSLATLKTHFGIERATAQRDMKLLKDAGFVIFKGAPKPENIA